MNSQALPFAHPASAGEGTHRPAQHNRTMRHTLQRGDHLFHTGTLIKTPYLVVSGALKSCVTDEHGEERVIGFHMPGEVVGLEALVGQKTLCSIIALGPARVVTFQPSRVAGTASGPDMMMQMYREISRLIQLLQMDRGSPDGRVAHFLIEYSEAQARRGSSPKEFLLPMGRYDLACHLGLAKETVSRVLSRFRKWGWLHVDNNHIIIIDAESLCQAAGVTRPFEGHNLMPETDN